MQLALTKFDTRRDRPKSGSKKHFPNYPRLHKSTQKPQQRINLSASTKKSQKTTQTTQSQDHPESDYEPGARSSRGSIHPWPRCPHSEAVLPWLPLPRLSLSHTHAHTLNALTRSLACSLFLHQLLHSRLSSTHHLVALTNCTTPRTHRRNPPNAPRNETERTVNEKKWCEMDSEGQTQEWCFRWWVADRGRERLAERGGVQMEELGAGTGMVSAHERHRARTTRRFLAVGRLSRA